jgi:hypothetical protein
MENKLVTGILGQSKKFTIHASFDLRGVMEIPSNITLSGMARYAKVRRPKRWVRNRRLNKKFCKNYAKYLPRWALKHWQALPYSTKAMNEICREEDRRIIEILKNSIPSTGE